MKSGARALGVAESYRADTSTLAGVVTRVDCTVDGVAFDTCSVGGTDATTAIASIFAALGRDDIQYLLAAGIAPAWYNVIELSRLHDLTETPVLSVSFEASDGLDDAIRDAFDGEAARRRLDSYRALPERQSVALGDDTVYVRSVGIDDDEAAAVVRAFTPEGGRPEPLRVARLVARGGDAFRRQVEDG
ncbi:hypothetical protein SAMN05216226_11533 [Halovenus aranensis]|uniref:UPF0215 protein SAMN05216226_11533 n=1 Tax=Halovenus aranensis TaxID=890420 RepID=A0A1G8YL75_9EURY|nr:DUF99 family protein [Halovenus aranensis]SDK03521.1 hypothetical protein SAMN05216226_11533 [Halovenus aranensis]